MTQKCDHCSKSINKSDGRIKCDACDSLFHHDCAMQLTPTLTKTVLEVLKKTGGSLIYKCNTCLTSKGTKSDNLNNKLDNLEKYMREITVQLMDIKKDLTNSINRNENFEKVVNSKIKRLEAENNNIRRQMNRADLIITGLPQTIPNDEKLYETIVDLAKALGAEISLSDLHFCSWIGKKSAILVKFNNVLKRDLIMKTYRSSYDLKLNQVILTEKEHSRVYINDHHTPLISKFRFYCRKLVKDKKIERYIMLNWDIPRARIVYVDGKEQEVDMEYLAKLYMGISKVKDKENPVAEEVVDVQDE